MLLVSETVLLKRPSSDYFDERQIKKIFPAFFQPPLAARSSALPARRHYSSSIAVCTRLNSAPHCESKAVLLLPLLLLSWIPSWWHRHPGPSPRLSAAEGSE